MFLVIIQDFICNLLINLESSFILFVLVSLPLLMILEALLLCLSGFLFCGWLPSSAHLLVCQNGVVSCDCMRELIFIAFFFAATSPLIAGQADNPKYNRDRLSGEYRCRRVREEIQALNDQLALTTRFRREELARQAKECNLRYTHLNR